MSEPTKDPHQWPSEGKDPAGRRREFGAKIRAAREAKGLSAQALSQLTRINQNYVEALEAGAFERLPGAVFGRGFVRCIAKNMGVPGEPLLSEFNILVGEQEAKSVLKVEIKNKPTLQRPEVVSKVVANAQSLVRRGIVWKVGLPIAAVVSGLYFVRHGNIKLPTGSFSKVLQQTTASFSQPEAPKTKVKELDLAPEKEAEPVAVQPEVAKGEVAQPVVAAAPVDDKTLRSAQSDKSAAAPVDDKTLRSAQSDNSAAAPVEAKTLSSAQSDNDTTPTQATTPAGEQVLELTVTEPVRVRLDVDKGQTVTKELTPDTYRFSFNERADLLIYDAAALKIRFNGKSLGSLGTKGRVRKLSFQAEAPQETQNR